VSPDPILIFISIFAVKYPTFTFQDEHHRQLTDISADNKFCIWIFKEEVNQTRQ